MITEANNIFHNELGQQKITNNLDLKDKNLDYFAYLDDIHDQLRHTIVSACLWYQAIFYNNIGGEITWIFIFKPMNELCMEEAIDHEQEIHEVFESVFPLDSDVSLIAPKISHINGTWCILVPASE